MLDAILISVQVAVVATLINLPIALLLSWLVVKKRIRGAFLLDILASLPLAVPPVVVGYMLLLMFGRHGPLGRVLEAGAGMGAGVYLVRCCACGSDHLFPADGSRNHGGDAGS